MAHRPAAPDAIALLQELLKTRAVPAKHRVLARHLVARFQRDGLAPPLSQTVHRFAREYRDGDPLGDKALELLGEMESFAHHDSNRIHVPPPPCEDHPERPAFGFLPSVEQSAYLCRDCWEKEGGWDSGGLGVYACSDACGVCEDLVHDQTDEEE